MHTVRQMLMSTAQNDLTDHQKRGILLAHEKILKPSTIEQIVRWDASRISDDRVSLLMGQQSTEIRSLERGGLVSTAARAGVMIHKLDDKKWGAVLAQTNLYQVQGSNIKESASNLKREFGDKSNALNEDVERALDSLIETLPRDDDSVPDMNLYILDSSGEDGGVQLTRSVFPFEGKLLTQAEAAQVVMKTITQSIEDRMEIEKNAEVQALYVVDLLSVEDLEEVADQITPADPLPDQVFARIEELSESLQTKLKEAQQEFEQSRDVQMDPEERERKKPVRRNWPPS